MATSGDSAERNEDLMAQIARLRAQVDALTRGGVSGASGAIADIAARAEETASGAANAIREQAEGLSNQVRQRPLISIAVALGIGWVLGRAMR